MLFGKSVFQSILTRLDEEAPEDETVAEEPGFRISGLPAGFVTPIRSAEAPARASDAYRELMADRPDAAAEAANAAPVMPDRFARLSEAEVAEDLGLAANDSADVLAEKRRAFARLNHPDSVHPDFRAQATQRMTFANMLVDRAIRLCGLR